MGGDFHSTATLKPKQSRFKQNSSPQEPIVPSFPKDLEKDSTTETENDNSKPLQSRDYGFVFSQALGQLETKFSSLFENLSYKINEISNRKPEPINIVLPRIESSRQEREPEKETRISNKTEEVDSSTKKVSNNPVRSPFVQIPQIVTIPSVASSSSSADFFSDPANVALVQALIVVAVVLVVLLIGFLIFMFIYKGAKMKKYNPPFWT